jgi:archaellum biogenesis protein FlaJ (TadC family)
MSTLLEFINFTKGVEYLIAIAFVIAFIAFWQLVYGRGKGLVIRIAVLAYMVVGIIILVGSCLTGAPQ